MMMNNNFNNNGFGNGFNNNFNNGGFNNNGWGGGFQQPQQQVSYNAAQILNTIEQTIQSIECVSPQNVHELPSGNAHAASHPTLAANCCDAVSGECTKVRITECRG